MRKITLWGSLALLVAATIGLTSAFAGDDAPAKPADKVTPTKTAPAKAGACEDCEGCDGCEEAKGCEGCEGKTVAAKATSPVNSMLGWISAEIKKTEGAAGGCCKTAMKAWFAGGKNVPLASLRDKMVADGWTADSTIAFFQKMAAAPSAKSDCAGCDGAAKGALVPTKIAGDASKAAEGSCPDCDEKGASACEDCDECEDCKDCSKKAAPAKPAKIGSTK